MIIIILLLLQGIASNTQVILKYRLEVGFPIGILDGLLFLGMVLVMLPNIRSRMPTERIHPLMSWSLGLFAAAAISGSVATFLSIDTDNYYYITTLRNFLTVPAAACVGYWLLDQPRDVKRYAFWYVVASTGVAIMTLLFFKERGELVHKQVNDLNFLRSMEYAPAVAGISATFLIYQTLMGIRQFPLLVTTVLAGVCFLGQSATLSRSDWVSLAATICSIVLLLPRERRASKSIKFLLAAPLVVLFLVVGINLASRATSTDFSKRMEDRLQTMLPGERTSKTVKAWDSRLRSQIREIELWTESPIFGQGFGHKMIYTKDMIPMFGYGHNTWTFSLYQSGLLGLAAMGCVSGGCWVIGRRMIRDANGERVFTLMGALAALSGTFYLFHGLTTASFNQPRGAIPFALSFGVVLRARMMQLELLRQQQELDYYNEQNPEGYDHDRQLGQTLDEPVFANWY